VEVTEDGIVKVKLTGRCHRLPHVPNDPDYGIEAVAENERPGGEGRRVRVGRGPQPGKRIITRRVSGNGLRHQR
jgi:hypothetical protein